MTSDLVEGSVCSEQVRLRRHVVEEDTDAWMRSPDFSGLQRVGGVDLSFIKGDDVNACSQLVVLSYPDLEVSSVSGLQPGTTDSRDELRVSDRQGFVQNSSVCQLRSHFMDIYNTYHDQPSIP